MNEDQTCMLFFSRNERKQKGVPVCYIKVYFFIKDCAWLTLFYFFAPSFAYDQLLDDQQSGHVEADSPHFLSIAPGIFKSAKFGIVRKLCQAGVG